jgi:hypothetical protein
MQVTFMFKVTEFHATITKWKPQWPLYLEFDDPPYDFEYVAFNLLMLVCEHGPVV